MFWTLVTIGLMIAIVIAAIGVGASLPREHVATMRAAFTAGPATVWTVISDPLADVAPFGDYQMMLMVDPPKHTVYRRLVREEFLPAPTRWQPLTRLAASLRDYPALGRTDFARFLRQYLSRVGISTTQWKAHYRRLAREATEYVQRSQHRKSHKLDGFTGA